MRVLVCYALCVLSGCLAIVAACGRVVADPASQPTASSCSVISEEGGARVSCGETSVFIPNGKDGENGSDGKAGENGRDGQTGAQGSAGSSGEPGAPGAEGARGERGYSTVVALISSVHSCNAGGITILTALDINGDGAVTVGTDDAIQSAEICHGERGSDGADGENAPPTPLSPVEIINPCGESGEGFDEVFLRLANGTILASFSENANGKNTRFSVLTPGNYMTTDGDRCYFTIGSGGTLTNEHH